jgi:hypothetical protein
MHWRRERLADTPLHSGTGVGTGVGKGVGTGVGVMHVAPGSHVLAPYGSGQIKSLLAKVQYCEYWVNGKFGKRPVRSLLSRTRFVKVEMFPILAGTVPVIRLPAKFNAVRLVKSPTEFGMGPRKLFLGRCTAVRYVEFPDTYLTYVSPWQLHGSKRDPEQAVQPGPPVESNRFTQARHWDRGSLEDAPPVQFGIG